MKKYLLSIGLLTALFAPVWSQDNRKEIGNLVVDGIPALPADLLERVDQYQNVRGASFADWDRDGKGLFISTRFAEVPQIHHVAAPGADRRQITFFKEPLGAVQVAPDKKQNGFLYSRDIGGNENYQIYFFDLGNGQSRLLTDGKSRNNLQGWNEAGTQLAFTSNQRNGTDLDLYSMDFKPNAKPAMLAELKGGGWGVADWSDDGKQMIMRCGVDLFGISNFTTFLKNTSSYRADLRRVEYGDERDPAMQAVFEQISPINKIKNITKPMLVYQGKNDPRVPLTESEQMVDGLKKQGNKVWYIMAKDEGHSLAKKANRDCTYGAMMLFLRDNLVNLVK